MYSEVFLQVALGRELLLALGAVKGVAVVNTAVRLEPVERIEALRANLALVRTLFGVHTFVQLELVGGEERLLTRVVHAHEGQLAPMYLGVRSQVACRCVGAQTAIVVAQELFVLLRTHFQSRNTNRTWVVAAQAST